MAKWWSGVTQDLHNTDEVFKSAMTPTREKYDHLYKYVTGPFRTARQAAESSGLLHHKVIIRKG